MVIINREDCVLYYCSQLLFISYYSQLLLPQSDLWIPPVGHPVSEKNQFITGLGQPYSPGYNISDDCSPRLSSNIRV